MRSLGRLATVGVAVVAGLFALLGYRGLEMRRLAAEVDRLEQERQELRQYVERLGASRRVAQINVLEQRIDAKGRIDTSVRFQEIAADGALGLPLEANLAGAMVYVEAAVIKFEPEFVAKGDPQRGSSLVMFRRIFGDQQSPQTGELIDQASRPPAADRGEATVFREHVWNRFWEFVDEPAIAADYGVRVAQCEAVAVPVKAGQVWELSLDAAGGLNLRRMVEAGVPLAQLESF